MKQNTMHEDVVNHMMENDYFSQWMGVEVLAISEGYSKIKMTIRSEMVNGFGIVHGGIPFSLAGLRMDNGTAFPGDFNRIVSTISINNKNVTIS